jgi:hypothetical protein
MMTTISSPSQHQSSSPLLRKLNNGGGSVGSFIHSYGSKKFIRPKIDDVLDAVAQARFNEKKWVWIEDENEGYVRGHIISENEEYQVEVEYENGGVNRFSLCFSCIHIDYIFYVYCRLQL